MKWFIKMNDDEIFIYDFKNVQNIIYDTNEVILYDSDEIIKEFTFIDEKIAKQAFEIITDVLFKAVNGIGEIRLAIDLSKLT